MLPAAIYVKTLPLHHLLAGGMIILHLSQWMDSDFVCRILTASNYNAVLLCTEAAVIGALMHSSRSLHIRPASTHPCSWITLNILSLCNRSCGNLRFLLLDRGVSSFTHDNCLVGLDVYGCIRTRANLHLHPHLFCQLLSFCHQPQTILTSFSCQFNAFCNA